MRYTAISFGRLQPGTRFSARDAEWIKGLTCTENGTKFNAYKSDSEEPTLREADIASVTFFYDETLVQYNPNEPLAAWAAEAQKAGE